MYAIRSYYVIEQLTAFVNGSVESAIAGFGAVNVKFRAGVVHYLQQKASLIKGRSRLLLILYVSRGALLNVFYFLDDLARGLYRALNLLASHCAQYLLFVSNEFTNRSS
ncbi:hypothetical protein [Legionella tunisiensis]|uniref:hypothetical protein n=1 Tax=Legionella tunisiensis TaxID=1034944 RepID=UPI001E49B650|nr:hypothetical protein [Legionella tunisiensis]